MKLSIFLLCILFAACAMVPRVAPQEYRDDPSKPYSYLLRQLKDFDPEKHADLKFCAEGNQWNCVYVGEEFYDVATAAGERRAEVIDGVQTHLVKPAPPIKTAVRIWTAACDAGLGTGCQRVAYLYAGPWGSAETTIEIDKKRAREWLERACNATIASSAACYEAAGPYWPGPEEAPRFGNKEPNLRKYAELLDRGCRFGMDGRAPEACELLAAIFTPASNPPSYLPKPNKQLASFYAEQAPIARRRAEEYEAREVARLTAFYDQLQQARLAEEAKTSATLEALSAALGSATAGTAGATSSPAATSSPSSPSASKSTKPAQVTITGDCSHCEANCAPEKRDCERGTMYRCYDAAACLCRCNLNGGCGDPVALEKCIADNTANSASYDSNAQVAPTGSPPRADPPPPSSTTTESTPLRGGATKAD